MSMTKARSVFNSTAIFWLTFVWLVFYSLVTFWPIQWWFEARSVFIASSRVGEPVPMVVDRVVKRPFTGIWYVTIRRWEAPGWVVYCNTTGTSNYGVDSKLPSALTLDWWTAGACTPLPEGRYAIDTTWRIYGTGPLPTKDVRVVSNIFEVTP